MKALPHPRFLLFLLSLPVAVAGFRILGRAWESAEVMAFDLAALLFMLSCLPLWLESGARPMRSRAARDDGGRVLLLLVSVAALGAVVRALLRIAGADAVLDAGQALLVVATLALAWCFVNTVYAFHYAHLYYDLGEQGDRGGLEFPGEAPPVFADFLYFSFVIGMTCQVSDVVVQTTVLRRTVLLHGLLSFLFNLGVLAMVVNVLAGAF